MPKIDEEEIRELFQQGYGYRSRDRKKWILDADGLLVLAGRHGLKGVKTELLHYGKDAEDKTWRAVVRATVEFDYGEIYQGICELTDRDVQHPKYFLRTCETFAIRRALRHAFKIPTSFSTSIESEGESVSVYEQRKKVTRKEIEEIERDEERKIAEAEETVEEVEW